ncbi:unnamed protein product [Phytomonas sp. Hart1]|nr:unnamed protein product [Phytomonas sp. Hart1]|eukprot:CCW69742.1 unnamed protein product [Phytomonas sp. isolate Hart1]
MWALGPSRKLDPKTCTTWVVRYRRRRKICRWYRAPRRFLFTREEYDIVAEGETGVEARGNSTPSCGCSNRSVEQGDRWPSHTAPASSSPFTSSLSWWTTAMPRGAIPAW